MTVDAGLDHLTEVVFIRFFHCALILFSHFPYCTLWKEVTMHNPHKKGVIVPLLKSKIFNYLFNY